MLLLDLYDKLRNLEMHLDKAVLKKKLMKEESHNRRIKCTKRLRFFIKYEKFDDSYHLQIDGRVINDFTNSTPLKMSDLLKSVIIKLNQADNAQSKDYKSIFEWSKSNSDFIDCFELNGIENHNSITLVLDFENTLDKYRLSDCLSKILNKETDTQTGVIIDIWKYIRLNRLVIDSETYRVTCDEIFKELLGVDSFEFLDIPKLILPHLLPLDPIFITIPCQNNYTYDFDVPIEIDDFFEFPLMYHNSTIFQLEQKIANLIDNLKRLYHKINILKKFSENPDEFINSWIIEHHFALKKQPFNVDHKAFYDPIVQQTIFEMMQSYK